MINIIKNELKTDITYFQHERNSHPELAEYYRGRIEEARFILNKIKELDKA